MYLTYKWKQHIISTKKNRMFNQSVEWTGIPKEAAFNKTEIYIGLKPRSTSFSNIHPSSYEDHHTEALGQSQV